MGEEYEIKKIEMVNDGRTVQFDIVNKDNGKQIRCFENARTLMFRIGRAMEEAVK